MKRRSLSLARTLKAPTRPWRRLASDRRASATIMTAFASTVLLGFMAVGVDGAHFYVVKRRLQTATDMAAIAAASTPAAAAATAKDAMIQNGYGNATLQVTPGTYIADPNLAPASRFTGGAIGNAVEVIATTREAFIFGTAFRTLIGTARAAGPGGGSDDGGGFAIRTRAVAMKQDQAAFTLGSGLTSLDGGILNALLGSLLGSRLSFSVLDYQALADASVDLFSFSDRLAARGLAAGPTYGDTSASVVTQSALLNTLADALQGSSRAAAALRWAAIGVPPGPSLSLAKLVDFGPAASARVNTTHPLSARVSALAALVALAEIGSQNHIVSVDLGTSVPSFQPSTLLLTVGEPAVGSSLFAIGPEGATLHTAQVRLLATVQIGAAGLPFSLSVPFYVELAPASATVASVSCSEGASKASATLGITPGLANAAIGDVSPSDFGSFSAAPTIRAATLATVAGLARFDALGRASLTAQTRVAVSFSTAEIKATTQKTISSSVSLDTLMNDLTQQTQVSVTVLGATLPQAQSAQALKATLQNALPPIDLALNQLLKSLGVAVGTATATVPGVRCGQGMLVN